MRGSVAVHASSAEPYGRTLRRFHLAIALFVVALAATGFSIYFRKPLGLQEWKQTLVCTHAVIAYSFLTVLAFRIVLGLRRAGPIDVRASLPRWRDLQRLFSASGRLKFAGRSPLSRTIAGVLYAAFLLNAATGLVRAGTDLYFPPFGPLVRGYVAADGVDPAAVAVGDKSLVDKTRFERVSRAKILFGKIHIYGAFIIAGTALAHVVGVIATEWSAPNDRRARGRARLMLFGPRRTR